MIHYRRQGNGEVQHSRLASNVCEAMAWIDGWFAAHPDHPWTYVLTWGDQRKEINKPSDLLQRGRYDDWE